MLTLLRTTLATVTYAAGKAPLVDMLRGVKTHKLYLQFQGTVVVSTAAAGNVTVEAYQGMIVQFRILEGGNPRYDLSGSLLGYLCNRSRRQAANWTGLPAAGASFAVATYNVAADFCLDFAQPTNAAGDPAESVFMDALPNVKTQIEVTWASNGSLMGTANPGNVSLAGMLARPVQLYDASAGQAPYFLPRVFRGTSAAFTAATTKFPILIYPQGVNRVQSVIFRGVTASLSDNTVWLNAASTGSFNFRGDRTKYWDSVPYMEVFDEFGQWFIQPAQNTAAAGTFGASYYLDLNFRRYGKISECYIGGQDQNPRLEADVTSGSSSVIEWYTLELETVSGVTQPLPSTKT